MRHHLRQDVTSPCYRRYHFTGDRPVSYGPVQPSATLPRVMLQHGWGTGLRHGTTAALTDNCHDNMPSIYRRLVMSTSSSSSSVHVGVNRAARIHSCLPHPDTRLSNHNTGRVSSQVARLRLPHDLRASTHLVLEAQRVGAEQWKAQPTRAYESILFFIFFLFASCVFL